MLRIKVKVKGFYLNLIFVYLEKMMLLILLLQGIVIVVVFCCFVWGLSIVFKLFEFGKLYENRKIDFLL